MAASPSTSRSTRKRKAAAVSTEKIDSLTNFEGGDILLYPIPLTAITKIFVGISHPRNVNGGASTTIQFAHALQERYAGKNYEVVAVHLEPEVLHLDLIFNILPFNDPTGKPMCILYQEGVQKAHQEEFIQMLLFLGFAIQYVDGDAAAEYVCNFINTGPNGMIVSESKSMRKLIKEWKTFNPTLHITLIPFENVYGNLGGSIRCSTLPVIRQYGPENGPSTYSVFDETNPLTVCMVGKLTPDKDTAICRRAIQDIPNPAARVSMLKAIGAELEGLVQALQDHGVIVLRPDEETLLHVDACNAIFARDGLLVLGHDVLPSKLHLEHRNDEHVPYLVAINKFFAGPSALSPFQNKAKRLRSLRKGGKKTKKTSKSKGGTLNKIWCSQAIVGEKRVQCVATCRKDSAILKKEKALTQLNKEYEDFLKKMCKSEEDFACIQKHREGNTMFDQISRLEKELSQLQEDCRYKHCSKEEMTRMEDCADLGEEKCRTKYADLIQKSAHKILPLDYCLKN
jgi:N-dimethylarginine dimethylaminohydrolase